MGLDSEVEQVAREVMRAARAGARVVEVDDGWAGNTIGNGVLRADNEHESGAFEAVVRDCKCRGQDQGNLVLNTF